MMMLNYDVEDKLHNINAKSLILGLEGYLFFNPKKDCAPLGDLIEDSKVLIFDSKSEKYYEDEDYSEMGFEIISFLKQFSE